MTRRGASLALLTALLATVTGGTAGSAAGYRIASRPDVRAVREASEMVHVPAGPFWMGVSDEERLDLVQACRRELGDEVAAFLCGTDDRLSLVGHDRAPVARRVWLHAYFVDRLEVTAADYRACVRAGGCDAGPLVAGDTRYARDEWPMVNVSWFDADTFCRWRGKRLPTEAEWEKAARGDDRRRWPWGSLDRRAAANFGMATPEELRPPTQNRHPVELLDFTVDESDGAKVMAPPGSFPWGHSPYGAQDMAGNVSEWVADWWSDDGYDGLPAVDPEGVPAGMRHQKVGRGGSYLEPRFLGRTYYRDHDTPSWRSSRRGFRCARDADPG